MPDTSLSVKQPNRQPAFLTNVSAAVLGVLLGIGGWFLLSPVFFPSNQRQPRGRPENEDQAHRSLLVPSEEIPGFPSEAICVLGYLDRQQRGTRAYWPRVAFAVGDGTLLLTAAHCVGDMNDEGKQAGSPETVVISPHYGDVFEFKVVAMDEKADVAVLRASWPAHPALPLAEESELAAAREMLVTGYPPPPAETRPIRFSVDARMEKIPVQQVSEQAANRAIVLRGTRFGGPGWSGSAIVLPKTGKAAGVLANLTAFHDRDSSQVVRKDLAGCSVRSIRALLDRHGLTAAATATPANAPPVENAGRAFGLAMKYLEAYWNKETTQALTLAQELVGLRPESAQARLLLAWSAHENYLIDGSQEHLLALAETNFQDALRFGPRSAPAHSGYGNFLMFRDRYPEALAEIEKALSLDANDDLALVNRVRILTKTDPAAAEQAGRELTAREPENPHFWFWYAGALLALKRDGDALDAAQKAVSLNPDGLYRGILADALARVGRLDEAEKCFRQMTRDCGCQHCWFNLAQFLIDHRPDNLDEADTALAVAESRTRQARVSKENLEKLRINLNLARLRQLEKETPEKAETLAQALLDGAPGNGHYWFALAGILRTRGKHPEAVEAARRAVQLSPDESFQPRLANTLTRAGRLDEAEQTYREMLRDHGDRPRYWFWYAEFLIEHYPERVAEWREALSKAEQPHETWSAPADELRALREKAAALSGARK